MNINNSKYAWSIGDLPGNREVCVSHGVIIYSKEDRNKGLGQKLHVERLDHMKQMGYMYALATVDKENLVQIHILQKNGWKLLDEFVSACTCNTVQLYGKHV